MGYSIEMKIKATQQNKKSLQVQFMVEKHKKQPLKLFFSSI